MTDKERFKKNFEYIVRYWLLFNQVYDFSKFETKWNIEENKPYISKWDYDYYKPTYDRLKLFWSITENAVMLMKLD